MKRAINTEVAFVSGCCPPGIYRSLWERLCEQLFGAVPMGMDTDGVLPDIEVWKDGVALTDDSDGYTFTVVTDGGTAPSAGDVILYKGKYYVIGAVD